MKENTKICSKCKRKLPLEEFYKNKRNSDGKCNACKSCIARRSKRYQRQRAREKIMTGRVKTKITVADGNEEEVEKIRSLYMDECLTTKEIAKEMGIGVPSTIFLIEVLNFRRTKEHIKRVRQRKRKEFLDSIRPSRDELEEYCKENNYSDKNIRNKYFPDLSVREVRMWMSYYQLTGNRRLDPQERFNLIMEKLKEDKLKGRRK